MAESMIGNGPTLQNGDHIPRILYGTARRKQKAPPDVYTALQTGYRGIDTASSRRFHQEDEDGRAIRRFLDHGTNAGRASRKEIFVQSKFAAPPSHDEPLPYNIGDDIKTRVLKSFVRSADDLVIDTLDAYFLHTPLSTTGATVEAWRVLQQLVSRGAVRYLGIANVKLPQLNRLYDQVEVRPTFVQNWFRKTTVYDREVMAFCKTHNITYQIFGVFDEENADLLTCEPVQRRAQEASLTAHQALLQLLFGVAAAQGLRLCVLDGTTSPDHMQENLLAVDHLDHLDGQDLVHFCRLIGWD
ncbi:NADP-dependent oxidoreductase domain-containing protein [Apiosordaria backusii]|uniref:NADP-dependent oxidoreductase domain-containing protein n=1 Tax=Apiosordaria backusii TaxID=314023 RepID=A0AA40ESX9_9PEZI|nr:NADP-dependent oxidoreductase domain-containing protein [Apiosordaria backusii]